MKRLLTIALAVTLLLAGCGTNAVVEKKSEGQATKTQVAAATSETTASNEPVEIEFWHALGGSLGDGLNEIMTDYNASQTQYVIKPVVIGSYSEIDEKLQAAYAADQVPALVAGGSYNLFASKGLVSSFEDYMPSTYDKADVVGGFLKAATIDGKLMVAPAYGTSQVLYVNKAVLKEAGKTVADLSSWQAIADMSSTIIGEDTNKDKISYVWEPMWGAGNIEDMARSNGAQFLSEDGKTVLINSPEWVSVLEQVRVWLHDDGIMKIHSGGQGWEYWYKTMDDWVYGKSLGYTGSPGDYVIAMEAINKAISEGYKNEFAVVHQPGWGSNDPAPYFSSLMYFIPNDSNLTEEQKKGAADFVTFATSTDNTAKFAIATGYAAVRKSVLDLPSYKEYLASNPDADVALKQIDLYAVPEFIDPTGGSILTALSEAVDKVEIENMSAQEALDMAAEKAQKELDKINK